MSRFTRPTLCAAAISAVLAAGACSIQRSMPTGQTAAFDDHTAHMMPADRMAPTMSHDGMAGMQQGDLSLPPSNNTAAARLAASPRHGEWVKISMGAGSSDSLMAWVVYPSTKKKAPVVVVVHEIFGLSTWVRGVADQVAAEGFIAVAPDFLSRVRGGPTSVELNADSARKIIAGVNADERNRVIAAAANYAMMLPAAQQKYAVIGYCWGGQTTFMHTINGGLKGFSGGVAFYGLPYTTGGTPATATTAAVPASLDVDSLRKIKKPIMLLSGSKDARIGAAMPALDSNMKKSGKTYIGTNSEGAVHGFLRAQADPNTAKRNEAEEAANLAATKDGWPKTVAFLKKNLGVK